jgi:pSer/pThr/pTyr-binding forkhead associated (FHA) protein
MHPFSSQQADVLTTALTISPLTPLCASKFAGHFLSVDIIKFPFKIGRDAYGDRGFDPTAFKNDLAVSDGEPFQVSRKHCLIECNEGAFFVRDTGSSLGTIVNGAAIGVRFSSLSQRLLLGRNTIILGTERSPFKFLIEIA